MYFRLQDGRTITTVGKTKNMREDTKIEVKAIFAFCALWVAPIIGIGAYIVSPVGSEPTVKLTPGHTVTLTALSGDKMTCPAPASGDAITCVLPDGEKAICREINEPDAKGIFNNCGQPWKWAWKDNLNGGTKFAADSAALATYDKNHPIVARSAF